MNPLKCGADERPPAAAGRSGTIIIAFGKNANQVLLPVIFPLAKDLLRKFRNLDFLSAFFVEIWYNAHG